MVECFGIPLHIFAIFICISPTLAYNDDDIPDRLPESLIPTDYQLTMNINPESTNYSGQIIITFVVADEDSLVSDIYLHADLNYITLDSIILNNNVNCLVTGDNEVEILKITCDEGASGESNLSISFWTTFSEDGFGMVKSIYVDEKGEETLIESYFKPTFARRAFPCMDEPDLTATFSVAITSPDDYTVISDTPVLREDFGVGWITTTFESTPKISTYLLSIFLSKFQAADIYLGSREFKVYARPEVVDMTSEVVGVYFEKIMDAFENYTGMPYENLSDTESYQVALPDYYSDSMGNFGLFTYRETDLLDEGNLTTNRAKQNIITSMAYRLSHEWFGGDVATKWWSDVWATESVATYLQYVVPDQIEADLELSRQFMIEVSRKAMQTDGMPYAQPLSSKESDISLNRQIEDKLSTDSYFKGAGILHMISLIFGRPEDFKEGLQYHLSQRVASDSDGRDILIDLAQAYGREALYSSVYEKYAFSPGYPIITAYIYQSNVLFDYVGLREKRFVYPMDNMTIEDGGDWAIPISTTDESEQTWSVRIIEFWTPYVYVYFIYSGQWIIFNIQGGCFYRVNYEPTLWRRLINGLKKDWTIISVLNRAQLVDDIFNIARTGDVSYYLAFEMADYLVNETAYYPWYTAFDSFSYILGKMEDDGVQWLIQEYILNLMGKVMETSKTKANAEDETHVDVLKRVMVQSWACKFGHYECIFNAKESFRNIKRDFSIEDNNLRGVTYCNGIRYSDNITDDWEFLWNTYTSTFSVHEQSDILNSLGCAEDKDLLNSYLLKTVTKNSGIKRQDVLVVFKSVFSSSVGLEAAMDFLEINYSNVQDHYEDIDIVADMVYAVAEKLITEEQMEWLDTILNDEIFDDYDDIKTKARVLVGVNNYWRNHFQGVIKDIFVPTTTVTTPSTSTTESSTVTTTPSTTTTVVTTTETTSESTTTEETTTGPTTTTVPTTTTTPRMSTGFTFEPSTTTEAKSVKIYLLEFEIMFVIVTILRMWS